MFLKEILGVYVTLPLSDFRQNQVPETSDWRHQGKLTISLTATNANLSTIIK